MTFRAAVMGDFHGNVQHFRAVTRTLKGAEIDLLLGVGDVGFDFPGAFRGKTEKRLRLLLEENGVEFIWAVGNHDNHDSLRTKSLNPDGTRRISDRNSNLPNGAVIVRDGVRIGALGGAYSVDRKHRTEGRDWWPQEEPRAEEAEKLIAACSQGPRLDIMLTHDVPLGVTGLKGLPGLSKQTLQEANRTRVLLQETVSQVRPKVLFAGHWHQRLCSELAWDDGSSTRVEVLAAEQSWAGNLAEVVIGADGEVDVSPLLIRAS
ncbi:metallophosphoesterase [Pseudarthrobacter sp. NamB4]|uniref:metallophosphoesterase family protein n=1 Tax=Pseudarthrobacter sp. NamB4 TaxID=2576837 RepID=UPI0010FF383E|nr:metallophosphoesterase [Pseudarthrobacter sp. NamB4]TLM73149.1 metallophosphoesterase [Pseudarthrobacter sp. NamB4]